MKETVYQVLGVVFTISLALFMLMGFAIVALQVVGAVLGMGGLVLAAGNCEVYAIYMSVLCGIVGFIAHYFAPKKKK